jgi:hypothetical protein
METDTFLDKISERLAKTSLGFQFSLFILYDCFLAILFWEWHSFWLIFYTNLVAVVVVGILFFSDYLIYALCALIAPVGIPVVVLSTLYENHLVNKFLKKQPKNALAEVAIVLGHPNWSKTEAWFKMNSARGELKRLVELLQVKKQTFSFYPNATQQDVQGIMADKSIKEVYFMGHGSSHKFQLSTDDILYYCDFNDVKYGKEFVHQVHCGTPDGKSLVDYVVSEENKAGCFFVRKLIRPDQIHKEFKRRIKTLKKI